MHDLISSQATAQLHIRLLIRDPLQYYIYILYIL